MCTFLTQPFDIMSKKEEKSSLRFSVIYTPLSFDPCRFKTTLVSFLSFYRPIIYLKAVFFLLNYNFKSNLKK
jgi:hypothetical protein